MRVATRTQSARSKRSTPDPTPILLAPGLQPHEVSRLLKPYGFQNAQKADDNLQSMAGDPQARLALASVLPELLSAVADTADPDQALNEWDRYLNSGIQRGPFFSYLSHTPRTLSLLCVIFGNSPAMAQTLIRDPLLLYWLGEEKVIARQPTRRFLEQTLRDSLSTVRTSELKLEALRRYKRRELLRIGVRDLLRIAIVQDTVAALSDLAAVTIQAAYTIIDDDMKNLHGAPMHHNSQGQLVETGFVVLGMGKLGGWELNYSSDVDLIYIYESQKGTSHVNKRRSGIAHEVYFENLARNLTQALTIGTQEGTLFRVDLRLRPEGTMGPLAKSVEDAIRYYETRGRDWERFAFLKACPIAGSLQVGKSFLRRLKPFVYGNRKQADERIFTTVRALKTQIHTKLRHRKELDRHVKLGTGGIREIEFLVQTLQLLHAKTHPRIIQRNTLHALQRLDEEKLLAKRTIRDLVRAYIFLRDMEHKLQMVYELQTHLLPNDLAEIAKCGVRLGYSKSPSMSRVATVLLKDYRKHTTRVHQIFKQIVVWSPSAK